MQFTRLFYLLCVSDKTLELLNAPIRKPNSTDWLSYSYNDKSIIPFVCYLVNFLLHEKAVYLYFVSNTSMRQEISARTSGTGWWSVTEINFE